MLIFPLWFVQALVIGGIGMCAVGVVALIAFLVVDSKDKNIW